MRSLVLALALALSACAGPRRRVEGDIVREIEFRGNRDFVTSAQHDDLLRRQMMQKQSPWGTFAWPVSRWLDPVLLDESLLERDARAVEVFLAHQGWYEAELIEWKIRRKRRQTGHKAGVVKIVGELEIGPKIVYGPDTPVIRWPDRPAKAPTVELLALLAPKPGYRMQLSDIQAAAAAMQTYLCERGFAAAQVTHGTHLRRFEREATVHFDVRSGPKLFYGPVLVEGATTAWRSTALEALADFEPGDRYDLRELVDLEQAVLQLGSFASVTVEPVLAEVEGDRVPILLRVVEAEPRFVELGGRVHWSGEALTPEVTAAVGHNDVADRFVLARSSANLGVSLDLSEERQALIYGIDNSLMAPRLWGPAWAARARADLRRELVEEQLRRDRILVDLHLLRELPLGLEAELGPGYSWNALAEPLTDNERAIMDSVLGIGFDPYTLTTLDARLTWDAIESGDLMDPRRGLWAQGAWQWAVPIIGRQHYQDLDAELRAWWTPKRRGTGLDGRTTLAGRLQLQAQASLDDEPIAWAERIFLGGPTSLRGFRSGQVGAYDCVCTERPGVHWLDEKDIYRHYLSRGGSQAGLASAELRVREVLLPDLGLAFFAEAGLLAEERADWADPAFLRWDVGGGVRYATPIGPLRLDLAFRPIYPEDQGPRFAGGDAWQGSYVNCDDNGVRRRPFDVFSVVNRTAPLARERFPAVNIYVTVGEAF
jgi:outer membrane protein assembly factor BamA